MKRFVLLSSISGGAFVLGIALALLLRGDFSTADGGDSLQSRIGEGPDGETSVAEAVNPELLRESRRLERMASGSAFSGLGPNDYPNALVVAGEENDIALNQSLFRDWVRRDREGMLRYFLRFGQVEMPASGLHWTLDAYMIRALVDAGPREAVAAILRFPTDTGYLADVLRLIGTTSPELAAELALENLEALRLSGNTFIGPEAEGILTRVLAERDPFGDDEEWQLKRLARFTNDKALLDFWSSLSPAARERTAGIFMVWRDDGSAEAGEFCTALLRQLEKGKGKREGWLSFGSVFRRVLRPGDRIAGP